MTQRTIILNNLSYSFYIFTSEHPKHRPYF